MFVYSVKASSVRFFGAMMLSVAVLIALILLIPTYEPVSAATAQVLSYDKIKTNEDRVNFLHGLGWEVEGSFWEHDFEITENGRPVVSIHKQWMTWGDCYELDIADGADEIIALAVVLAIDCVQAAAAHN